MKVYDKTEVDVVFSDWQSDLDELSVIEAIPIPNNATNGDMIMVMFPNAELYHGFRGIVGVKFGNMTVVFDEHWWNAPYKADKERNK